MRRGLGFGVILLLTTGLFADPPPLNAGAGEIPQKGGAESLRSASDEVTRIWQLRVDELKKMMPEEPNALMPDEVVKRNEWFGKLPANIGWEELRSRVEKFQEVQGFLSGQGLALDAVFAEAWMKQAPQRSLAWYDSRMPGLSHGNGSDAYAFLAGRSKQGVLLARLVGDWMARDGAADPWLSSWTPRRASADEVFTLIADNESYAKEIRERAKRLVRDADWLKHRLEAAKPEIPDTIIDLDSAKIVPRGEDQPQEAPPDGR